MNGSMDPLRHALADLAEEVRPVDLRDQVLRTSRRLAVRRAVVTSTAAVAVLAVASGIALAVLPQRGTTPPIVATSTPATSPDASPSTPPGASPSAPAPGGTAKILPGRLFYGNDGPVEVYGWDGRTVTKVLALDKVSHTPRVSPDGSRLAWVNDAGQLHVANADGSGIRKVRDNLGQECVAPTWAPDSRRVLVGRPRIVNGSIESFDLGYVDVDSGAFRSIPALSGCHFTLSAGGAYLAYVDGSHGKVWIARPDGTGSREVPILGDEDPVTNPQRTRTFDIHSLSSDGNLLICQLRTGDQANGDVALTMFANAVIDTRTGKQVDLPVDGELINAVFLTDGSLLVRLKGSARNELVLISKDWKVIDRIDEPAELKDDALLAYIPA